MPREVKDFLIQNFILFFFRFQPLPFKNDGRRCPPMKSEDSLLTLSLNKHGRRCPPMKSEAREEAEAQTFPPREVSSRLSVRNHCQQRFLETFLVNLKPFSNKDFTLSFYGRLKLWSI